MYHFDRIYEEEQKRTREIERVLKRIFCSINWQKGAISDVAFHLNRKEKKQHPSAQS